MLVKTGSYTGDGTSSRNIDTGLGVQIKFLVVKGGANTAIWRTTDMTGSFQFTGGAVTAITALGSTGIFTINSSANANANGTIYYWIAVSDADGLGDITTGTYTGDGTTGRAISSTLNPVLVVAQRGIGTNVGCWRSSAHSGANASFFDARASTTNLITALGTGTFTIGSSATVNSSGSAYFWVAFGSSNKVSVGTYTGNAVDDRDISANLGGIIAAFVKNDAVTTAMQFRNDAFADDSSALITADAPASNSIERFVSGGLLEIGTDASVNSNAVVYHWFAFGKVSVFSGDDDVEYIRHKGDTSQILHIYIRNSNTNAGLSGLAFGTSGLTAYYSYTGDTASHVISLVTMTLGTWASGGFKEVDSVNMPGVYQVGIPDAALANGTGVRVVLQGAANMLEATINVQLIAANLDDSTALGVSRIDATVSSRSTYAGADTSGTTTLLSRIASALSITSGKVDVNDKTGFALTTGEHTLISGTDIVAGLNIAVPITPTTNSLYDYIKTKMSQYTGGDTAGTTTLLSRLTSTRAGLLDNLSNLDAAISGIAAAVWGATTRTLSAFSDSAGITTLLTRIPSALTITSGKIEVNDKTGFALTSAYDSAKIAASATSLSTTNDTVNDIKAKTDNLPSSSMVNTGGKLWVLNESGNPLASSNALTTLSNLITALLASDPTQFSEHALALAPSGGGGGGGDQWATVLDGTYTGDEAGAILQRILDRVLLIELTGLAISSPNVPGTNDIILVENNDYLSGSGQTLPAWTDSAWDAFDLPDAQSILFVTESDGETYSISLPVDLSGDHDLSLQLARTDFSVLAVTTGIAQMVQYPSKHVYSIEAVLENGNHETLRQGNLFILGSKS